MYTKRYKTITPCDPQTSPIRTEQYVRCILEKLDLEKKKNDFNDQSIFILF